MQKISTFRINILEHVNKRKNEVNINGIKLIRQCCLTTHKILEQTRYKDCWYKNLKWLYCNKLMPHKSLNRLVDVRFLRKENK